MTRVTKHMCKAWFLNGYPLIYAFVLFPAHRAARERIPALQFLIDSGADKTMLNAIDAEKLGIEYRLSIEGKSEPFFGGLRLPKGPLIGGIGGGLEVYEVEDVLLIFRTERNNHIEYHEEFLDVLYIPEGTARSIPNLLGRDILNRFDFSWEISKGIIDFSRASKPGSYRVIII